MAEGSTRAGGGTGNQMVNGAVEAEGKSSCRDARGILRGACSICSDCVCYKRESDDRKMKCAMCGHPPGKHKNLSAKPKDNVFPMLTDHGQECKASGCTRRTYFDPMSGIFFHYCSPECRDEAELVTSRSQLEADIKTLENDLESLPPVKIDEICEASKYHTPCTTMSCIEHQCKAEYCMERVYFDYFLQVHFPYCSPLCRDRDLLQNNYYHRKMSEEIKELEEKLESLAPVYYTQPQAHKKGKSNTPASTATPQNIQKKKQQGTKQQGNMTREIVKDLSYQKGRNIACGITVYGSEWLDPTGLLVTGVRCQSKEFKLMQNSQLYFFDVIIAVDDQPISQLPGKTGEEKLHNKIFTTSSPGYSPTHMIAVMDSLYHLGLGIKNKNDREYSLRVQQHSAAYLSGLRDRDEFVSSVIASREEKKINNSISNRGKKKLYESISKTFNEQNNILIAVERK